ncbi:unnamed protein product [Phytophthora fragariaefolia]|uniref:Unnamed protein product n=1 Tax=Phytophthora fragariaefolia TaxID=1490495 RepID=A0A9W6TPZ0_9STRA|nr:unnamed protein product [Phytophthora fragariaefolia]
MEAPGSKKLRLEKEIIPFAGTGTRVVDPENWQLNQWINTRAINNVTDFPPEYFVRQESIDIFQLPKTRTKQIVLFGSLGIGKSLLLVLYSFWVAFGKEEKKSVMLLRNMKGERQGVSVIYLNALDPNKNWKARVFSIEEAIDDGVRHLGKNDILCLDDFKQSDINQHFAGLIGFSVFATAAQYLIKSDDSAVLKVCLVSFWSLSDLKQVGVRSDFDGASIEKRYYFSGGNLRSFLVGESDAKKGVDTAFRRVTFDKVELLKTQYSSISTKQVDHIRMATVKIGELMDYFDPSKWNYVICSGYALMKLGEIVTLEYFQDLCTKAYAMKDFGLFGVAFENQIHAMARHKKEIRL